MDYYKRTLSGDLRLLMKVIYSLSESSADQVAWIDWGCAVKKVLQEQNSKKYIDEILGISVTESQAFKAMVQFFRNYYEPEPDDPDAVMFFDYLYLLPDSNDSSSFTVMEKWKTCVGDALKEKPGVREYLFP